jgi:hypothetical protein
MTKPGAALIGIACQDIKTGHMQRIVNAAPTAGERPGRLPVVPRERADRCPRVPLPFGRRHSLPGHPSRLVVRPSCDRPTASRNRRTMTGFPCSAHMRYGRNGRPLYPATGGAHTGHEWHWPAACRFSAARVLSPGSAVTYPGLKIHPVPLCACRSRRAGPLRLGR